MSLDETKQLSLRPGCSRGNKATEEWIGNSHPLEWIEKMNEWETGR